MFQVLVPRVSLKHVQRYYHDIPVDPYVSEGFRRKKIMRVRYDRTAREVLVRAPHGPLFQSSEVNPTHGDIIRHYPEMLDVPDAIMSVVSDFADYLDLHKKHEILVQAQRIQVTPGVTAKAAVEGLHRDNVDWLGIYVVDRHNIDGAETTLCATHDMNDQIFQDTLEPGQLLMVDDRTCYHYTSDVAARDETRVAYRDVLLLGAPACREPDYMD